MLSTAQATHVHVRIHTRSEDDSNDVITAPDGSADAASWSMKPVRAIHARVQGDMPMWDNEANRWSSKYGDTAEERYFAALANVNTASPEGALHYVQAECINVRDQNDKCERKNKVKYVVFYETEMSQPEYAMAVYGNGETPEYCPYLAFDEGKCSNAGNDLPEACKQFYGLDGEVKIGVCVGAGNREVAKRGPYPGNYWFSFPGACAHQTWGGKTPECNAKYPTGMCPMGVKPDGQQCVFSYKILGFVAIDDVVGITKMVNSKTNAPYSDFKEFCEDNQVEFDAKLVDGAFEVVQSIPFWEDPSDPAANQRRYEHMVKTYNHRLTQASEGVMEKLPTVEELTASNPKCYETSAKCATAKHGCRRMWHSQICSVCRADEPDCHKAPAGYVFPELKQPPTPPKPTEETSSTDGSEGSGDSSEEGSSIDGTEKTQDPSDNGNKNENNDDDEKDSNSSASISMVWSAVLATAASLAMTYAL